MRPSKRSTCLEPLTFQQARLEQSIVPLRNQTPHAADRLVRLMSQIAELREVG